MSERRAWASGGSNYLRQRMDARTARRQLLTSAVAAAVLIAASLPLLAVGQARPAEGAQSSLIACRAGMYIATIPQCFDARPRAPGPSDVATSTLHLASR